MDAGVRLDHCVVGTNCHIGRSATMQGSCLHAHVRVDEGCTVSAAVLAEQVVVRSHAKVEVRAVHARRCSTTSTAAWSGLALRTFLQAPLVGCVLLQTGAVLAKRTVVDTAHCVPAGARISLTQQRAAAAGGSDEDMEWRDAGMWSCLRPAWEMWRCHADSLRACAGLLQMAIRTQRPRLLQLH